MKIRFKSAWTLVPAALLLFVLAIPLGTAFSAVGESPRQPAVEQQDPAAQDPAEPAPATQQPEAPPPYLPAEIPTSAEAIVQRLAEIEQITEVDAQITAVEESLPARDAQINADFERLEAIDSATVIGATVESEQQRWLLHQQWLAGPGTTVAERSGILEDGRVELQGAELRWRITLDSLEDEPEEVATPLRDRIGQVLSAVADTQTRLQGRAAVVLALQNRISDLNARVTDALNRTAQLETVVRQRVLTRDSVPLWRAGFGEVGAMIEQAREAMRERRRSIASFYGSDPDGVTLQVLLFLVLVGAAYALRQNVPAWSEVEGAEALVYVLSRPISGAAIFTLLLTTWIYSSVPTAVVDLMLLVTVVPVMRLAPGLARTGERAPLYGLLGLYVVLKMFAITPEGSLLRRLVLLAVTIVAFAGLVRFVASSAAAFIEGRSRWWRFASLLKRAALVLLALAIALDILGWTQLAALLFSGTVQSAYAAVIVWVFAAVACGLAAVVPVSRIGDWLPSIRRKATDFNRVAVVVIQLYALWTWAEATASWFLLNGLIDRRWEAFVGYEIPLGELGVDVGHVLAAILVLMATPLVSRLVRFFFMEEIRPRMSLPRGSAVGVASLIHYVIVTLGILIAAAAAGLGGTQLAVVFGALGVGIGFGLQNITNNFISGLILIFERPITVGDRITVGANQQMGVVTHIGIRASTVRTFDGAEIVVPNGDLISKDVTNWTLSDMTRRVTLQVGVEYGTDPYKMNELLCGVARAHPDVLADPEPQGLFVDFAESCLMFELRYWVPMEEFVRVQNDINLGVHDALAAADIRVPFPQRAVHLSTDRYDAPELAVPDESADEQ